MLQARGLGVVGLRCDSCRDAVTEGDGVLNDQGALQGDEGMHS